MKVRYRVFGADALVREHIRRSIDFDNVDMVYMARKSLNNLEKSRLTHLVTGDMKLIVDSMKDRSKSIMNQMDKMFKLTMEEVNDGVVDLTLYIDSEYFVVGDSIKAKFGRLGQKLVKFMSRQGIIDGIENNLRQTYGLKFVGEVLESDGKKLKVGAFL
jgi:hypothetical protein